MSNAWWYGAITIASAAVFSFTLWKVRDRRLIALYTLMAGVTYLAEYAVLVLFNAYLYRPHVLENEYFDSIVGAVVSDAFSVPMLSVLAAAFRFGWKWKIALSGAIVGVEVLFVHLRIYEHHWWKFPYTGFGLLAWFSLAQLTYGHLSTGETGWLRWVILFCTNVLIQASAVFALVALFGAYHYEIGWFADKTRDHVAFATAYILILSSIFTTLVVCHAGWLWRIALILLLMPVNGMLIEVGVLQLSDRWSLGHFFVLRVAIVAALDAFDRLVLGRRHQQPQAGQ